jgi:hypothetical protein
MRFQVLVLFLLRTRPPRVFAQVSARVPGTVTDPFGAAESAGTVTARNGSTEFSRTINTN